MCGKGEFYEAHSSFIYACTVQNEIFRNVFIFNIWITEDWLQLDFMCYMPIQWIKRCIVRESAEYGNE